MLMGMPSPYKTTHIELVMCIFYYSFEKPSAIQQRAIIPCIKGECIS